MEVVGCLEGVKGWRCEYTVYSPYTFKEGISQGATVFSALFSDVEL